MFPMDGGKPPLVIGNSYTERMPSPIICLYGGEDIKWIEEFTTAINRIKDVTKLSMDLVYVSQSKAINQTNKAIFDFITGRKLGVYWNVEETYSWRFWARLESIFSSGLRKGIYPKVNNTMKMWELCLASVEAPVDGLRLVN
ncbi:hypothetical protein GH714_024511 [Hevea brasiliensis]|uniref:Sieve element occlusion C-terminal domain-containing protein n=1 Tax=Hevea brasiliensis TaxID=3981 RepID=A0A6A6KWS1_HEVBR|nr:hypothetical protein GH714_024511 [Hevea brasiliensis]